MNILKTIVVYFLTLEARAVLYVRRPKIVAVTGSVGKTSTKDALASVLAIQYRVGKSRKSMNGDVGVPLTILNLNNAWRNPFLWFWNLVIGFLKIFPIGTYPEWLVLEVGADQPGDLQKLFSWLFPDVVVATRFPAISVHVANYESPGHVIEEETIPIRFLRPEGLLIVNGDDEVARNLAKDFPGKTISYGFAPGHDVVGDKTEIVYESEKKVPTGMALEISVSDQSVKFQVSGVLGIQALYPALASVALGRHLGISLSDMSTAFTFHHSPPGRMRILPGIKETTLIDDSYNSSPVAVEEALKTLLRLKEETSRRVIAALGDMRELGRFSDEEHRKAGLMVGKVADVLITVGIESRNIADGALSAHMDENRIYQFDDSREAGKFLESVMQAGDIILIKGSEATIRMERAVKEVMAEPDRAEELLVRQESAWQKR